MDHNRILEEPLICLHHRTFMNKTQYMNQCRLGAGRHQKYLHSSNSTCTNLHMQVVFRALTAEMAINVLLINLQADPWVAY